MSKSNETISRTVWPEREEEDSDHNLVHQQIFVTSDARSSQYTENIEVSGERYTVYPMGNGNFLKIYHAGDKPKTFHNYELFANNSFTPNSLNGKEGTKLQEPKDFRCPDNATNMIINQLVTNWTPNMSGTYSPFGEQITTVCDQQQNFDPLTSDRNIITENVLVSKSSVKTNSSFKKSLPGAPEIRKRIIAEVKPMRMSYSDVLTKNSTETVRTKVENICFQDTNNQYKGAKSTHEKKQIYMIGHNEKKKCSLIEDKERAEGKTKKLEQINNRSDFACLHTSQILTSTNKLKKPILDENKENAHILVGKTTKKNTIKSAGKQKNQKLTNKKRKNLNTDEYKRAPKDIDTQNEKDVCYNVTKNSLFEKQCKSTQYSNIKKIKQNVSCQKANSRTEKQGGYSKRSFKTRKNDKYQLLIKCMEKWLEYMLKIFWWLIFLVYDVVYLGLSVVYDRATLILKWLFSYVLNLREELTNNSGRPSIWFQNISRQINSKFAIGSMWIFLTKLYKREIPESTTAFNRNDRLPQTGEEAMYSLLNCKGKDAYSILGVASNSTQEQIRKHYKKIAVLVHPDKNKQPGAEEAFKVLQRAFELIGETENRKSYDHSLAEALNTEKAWSELNDLLSQLQLKIAEAANTIRCSSCGFRHSRKKTDRPHYAARECGSCKIRHSAREGDIWAETMFFGLRWKYLALMEGKVYDITEWANCQKDALSHLQPNSHMVQYRIVRGAQQQEKEKKKDMLGKPTLNDFLDNLYSGQNRQAQQTTSFKKRSKRS